MAGELFRKATKEQAYARVGLAGPAGSGKTYTALAIATALCAKVAVIDTEHRSASKYADEFDFDVLELEDFHPDHYVAAIKAAEAAGYDGLVIDSISHEWNGKNGCLELVDATARRMKNSNSYVAWGEVTPIHNRLIEAILASRLHIFATMRSKMDYLQTEVNGKKSIQKVGLAPVTRDGVEYEFDIMGEIDLGHEMVVTKSRAKGLADTMWRKPGADFAEAIKAWLTDGAVPVERPRLEVVTPRPNPASQPTGSAKPKATGKPQTKAHPLVEAGFPKSALATIIQWIGAGVPPKEWTPEQNQAAHAVNGALLRARSVDLAVEELVEIIRSYAEREGATGADAGALVAQLDGMTDSLVAALADPGDASVGLEAPSAADGEGAR